MLFTRSQKLRRACGSRPVVGSSRKIRLRAVDQRNCEQQPLPLASRELAIVTIKQVAERALLDNVVDIGLPLVQRAEHLDGFAYGQEILQRGVLELDAGFLAKSCAGNFAVVIDFAGCGRVTPSIISTVVVLPAPLGPSSPKQMPSGTEKLTPSTAVTPGYSLTRLRASRAIGIGRRVPDPPSAQPLCNQIRGERYLSSRKRAYGYEDEWRNS